MRSGVYQSRLCTLDICLVVVIICLVWSHSVAGYYKGYYHDSMLLRVFFIFFFLCLCRHRSLWEWRNAAPLCRQRTESRKSHAVSNLGCHWHKGWREQVHELSPMNSKWAVCKTRLLIIDLYKLSTVSQVAQEPQKNCIAHFSSNSNSPGLSHTTFFAQSFVHYHQWSKEI